MEKLKCVVCKAEWFQRTEKPIRCARCQSYKWEGKEKVAEKVGERRK